ncbi:hypothetical protein [Pantoea dispersa]|uniref:hypothetical protein n=1 Tax=Pantoea dispersa TaxID=59814 RepID=UPI00128EA3C6|nr:hypothetical protein [Pantoea dispersa]
MNALNDLIRSLEKMIVELNANGKIESAIFFTNWYNETIKCGDKVSLEILEKLSTCRAMSQYANFSQKEEMLLDDVVDNAIAVKNKVP